MKSTVFILIVVISQIFTLELDEDGYPDVQDLFEVIPFPQVGRRSPIALNSSYGFDLERIDINKFKRKMEMFAITLMENTTKHDTRRQKIPLNPSDHYRATKTMIRAKTLDLMLQVIYMARHQIQALEASKYFSITDTGYRIAFIYRRLRRLWRKMMDIHTWMVNKIKRPPNPNGFDYFRTPMEHIMRAHLATIKLHTDFLNLWWVLINLDGKYTERLRATTTTTPPPETMADVVETGPTVAPTGPAFLGTRPPTTIGTRPPLPPGVDPNAHNFQQRPLPRA